MLCPNCNMVSLGSCCHSCGACESQLVGFDLPNPFAYAYDLGRDLGSGNTPIPTPAKGYELGQELGNQANLGTNVLKGSVSAVSSFANTMKWVAIGGAALAGTVVLFSVYQAWKHDLPGRSLEAFKESERQKMSMADKYLSRGR